MGAPEGEEKESGEILETIMTGDFPRSTAGANPQVQEAQRTPNKMLVPNMPPKWHLGKSFSNYRKSKLKGARHEKLPYL